MSEMNKYVKMFMDDHDLKVGDEFRIKGIDVDLWHFTKDGYLENQVGFGNYKGLVKLLLGEYEIDNNIKKEPWKPELHGKYWAVSYCGNVYHQFNNNDEHDKYIRTHYLIFQTKKEAEDYKWFLNKVDEYRKPFKPGKDNCYFYYDNNSERVFSTCDQVYPNQGTIFFGDENNINEFLKEVGEERIKKYWFSIWR